MNATEASELVALMALYDNRKASDPDVVAWLKVIGDLDYADCETAILAHYRETRERIMPADVRIRVKALRRARLEREIVPAPPPEVTDEPGRYRETLGAGIREIADGRAIRRAIGGPVREDDPPPTWAEARATMPVPRVLTPQEKALQQAAESRAAREAADGEDPAA